MNVIKESLVTPRKYECDVCVAGGGVAGIAAAIAAKRAGADYAVDVYPYYGSDVEATLEAGNDLVHGLIGPGVYASHGYERSHRDGVYNTLLLLKSYLGI